MHSAHFLPFLFHLIYNLIIFAYKFANTNEFILIRIQQLFNSDKMFPIKRNQEKHI